MGSRNTHILGTKPMKAGNKKVNLHLDKIVMIRMPRNVHERATARAQSVSTPLAVWIRQCIHKELRRKI